MYIGIYIGFFALIGLVVTLPLIGYFVYKNESIEKLLVKSNVIKMIFSTIIAVFFLYLLFSPYIEYKEASGGRSFSEILSMLPRLESWFFTTGSIIPILNTVGSRLPMAHEHVMFLGFLTYAAFFVAVIYYIKIMNQVSLHKIKNHFMVLWSLVMICSIFIVTIVVGDHYTLYKNTIYLLPGLDAIRAVTRINLFLLFPFAFLVAFLIDRFESSTEVKRVIKFFALFFLLVLFVVEQYRSNESISHYSKNESQQRYFFIKDMIKNIDENYDLIYLKRDKPSSMFYEDELDAMYLGLMVNKPVINGYSGNIPNAYELWHNNNYQKWVAQNFSQFKDKKMLIVENDVIWRIEDLNSLASFKVTASTK
jgi:hypothetical protein